MRYNIIKHILKKELKDIFRDKKTIFMMIILPILLYPVLMVGGAQIGMLVSKEMTESTYKVAVEKDVPSLIKELIEADEQLEIITVEEVEEAINDEEIGAALGRDGEKSEQFIIYYNASDERSGRVSTLLEDVLEAYKEQLVQKRLEAEGMIPEEVLQPITYETKNIAKNEEMAGYFLAMILPFILIIGIASGAVYPAIDVMAGEKERGTIETLLTLPVSNVELIMGKYLAVATVALMSAFLNLLSIGASIGLLIGSVGMTEGVEMPSVQMGQFVLPLCITIVTIFLFTLVVVAISMSICALAKSFKEAQNYITPMLFIIMIPSYVTMLPTVTLTSVTASIPIVNIALLMKSVLMFKYDLALMSIVLISNMALVILSIFLLVKIFNSEDILFGSGKEFAILQRRYNIAKGTMPTPSDAFVVYGIALLALIYVGQLLQVKLGFWGIALTQVVLVSIALGFAYYIKTDWRKTFSIKIPTIRQTIGALVLWVGTFICVLVVSNLLLPLSPVNQEVLESLSEALTYDNVWINLLVVACMPAICEELLFRGIIYKGIENNKSGRRAVIITALLFGLMHMDLIRIPSTMLLGLALAYVVYETGSIFLAMLIHLVNNGIAVLSEHIPPQHLAGIEQIDLPLWGWTLVGIAIAAVGICIIRQKKGTENERNSTNREI